MKKNLILICSLACLIGFLTVLPGCDQTSKEPRKPKIVTKKIKPTGDKSGPPSGKPARAAQPAAKPEPPAPAKQPPERPMLAQKTDAQTAKPPETKKPVPSLTPKSDISSMRSPSPQQPDNKATPDQPSESDGLETAAASTASEGPQFYNAKGKVDPFEPLFREKPTVATAKSKRKKRIPRTPLEKIDLSQLRLVGIILASSGNKALVEESNGKGYVIRKGTYIGTNAGKVVKIQSDKVIVAEEYEDVVGNMTLRNKELKLPKPPGEF